MDSDVFPASHEGRFNAVCCQSLVFNWLPCVDHWTDSPGLLKQQYSATVLLPIRTDSLASIT